MTEQERRVCEDCLKHDVLALKVSQLCAWRAEHEAEYRHWKDNCMDETRDMEKSISRRFDDLKMWLIGNLVAIIFLLGSSILSTLRGN